MAKLWLIVPLFLLAFYTSAHAGTTADKIATLNRQIGDPENRPQTCFTSSHRVICVFTLYHYEVDSEGRLYFTQLTAYNAIGYDNILEPSSTSSTFICRLNDALACDPQSGGDTKLDLSAYSVNEDGVNVHSKMHEWSDAARAEKFLPAIHRPAAVHAARHEQTAPPRAEKPKEMALTMPPLSEPDDANAQAPRSADDMMQELSCYMFGFAKVVTEYKKHGHLVENDSINLMNPDSCLVSFEKICADPGSCADEVALAANPIDGPAKRRKSSINAGDIRKFCNSMKETKSAMLR